MTVVVNRFVTVRVCTLTQIIEKRPRLPAKVKQQLTTGGPPLTRKSLTRFPLTRFLAYVRVSWGISVSRGHSTVPLKRISCDTMRKWAGLAVLFSR